MKTSMISNMKENTYQGGCHCGAIRFRFYLNDAIENETISSCNCSMCEKTGYLHLIVAKQHFKLTSDWQELSNYQFNKKIAQHYFCKSCGIKSFYQPRSHPECWSINVRCLDGFSDINFRIKNFDGKNWEQNIHSIR